MSLQGHCSSDVCSSDLGLTVLIVAEGSRTHLTWLPRAKQFWIGPRWSPADMPPPSVADAQLGPLEIPALTQGRPPKFGRASWRERLSGLQVRNTTRKRH